MQGKDGGELHGGDRVIIDLDDDDDDDDDTLARYTKGYVQRCQSRADGGAKGALCLLRADQCDKRARPRAYCSPAKGGNRWGPAREFTESESHFLGIKDHCSGHGGGFRCMGEDGACNKGAWRNGFCFGHTKQTLSAYAMETDRTELTESGNHESELLSSRMGGGGGVGGVGGGDGGGGGRNTHGSRIRGSNAARPVEMWGRMSWLTDKLLQKKTVISDVSVVTEIIGGLGVKDPSRHWRAAVELAKLDAASSAAKGLSEMTPHSRGTSAIWRRQRPPPPLPSAL